MILELRTYRVPIRAFRDEPARLAAERDFYGSVAWREGPRDEILRHIESFHTVVLDVHPSAVEALRRT